MTNEELGRLVLNEVWGRIPVDTILSMVLGEVVSRLAPGLDEDEDAQPSRG